MSPSPEVLVRFDLRQRIEHLLVMLTFVALVGTGLPQRYADAGWAQGLIAFLGGIDVTRLIHRVAGFLFAALAVEHVVWTCWLVLRRKAPLSLVPGRRDIRDLAANLRYYLGLSAERPQFDRYDYRQKFEYWGLVVGGMLMIATGFVLYFPTFFARFLPGQVIAAAKTAHSYEAMMAVLVVSIWHMYGAHFNPDTFPVDASIFTGRISRERMAHEHPLEYARLQEGADAAP